MCFGGSSSASSTSQSANQTTVNVSTPISVDTAGIADALQALAGTQQQAAKLKFVSDLYTADQQVAAAKITARAGPSWSTILIVVAAVAGLAFTAGVIKLPRSLRA